MRAAELTTWCEAALELDHRREEVVQELPEQSHKLARRLHTPWLRWAAERVHFEEMETCDDLENGFPYVDDMPKGVHFAGPPKADRFPKCNSDDLRERRRELNEMVLSKVKDMEHLEDLWNNVLDDVELGAMSEPRPLVAEDMDNLSFTRALPVREERLSGWRTRVVYHSTEAGTNDGTKPGSSPKHDTVDALVFILLTMMRLGLSPLMFKRDISQAFRRVPIRKEHLDLAAVVFWFLGETWVSEVYGMPFGSISAVHAWHRISTLMLIIILRACKAPLAKYVDDFFGASR